jgi:hypothetical protein
MAVQESLEELFLCIAAPAAAARKAIAAKHRRSTGEVKHAMRAVEPAARLVNP